MLLDKKRLWVVFAVTLCLTLFMPILFPELQVFYLAPVVVIAIYQRPVVGACWVALGCGLILDLLYAQDRFGPYTVSFVLATALIYNQKRHFFADNIITLPIMTYLLSISATCLQFIYIIGMERTINISPRWILVDLIFLPLLDGLVAFGLFIAPSFLMGHTPRRGEEYFSD